MFSCHEGEQGEFARDRSHLSNPGHGCEDIHEELPMGDVIPGHSFAVDKDFFLRAPLADEADVEVKQQLHEVDGACKPAIIKMLSHPSVTNHLIHPGNPSFL